MHIRKRRWLFTLLGLALLFITLTIPIAIVLAEGAIHPPVQRHQEETAAAAYSVAHAVNGSAREVKLTASDGVQLNAWWILPEHPNSRAVVVCHGIGDSAIGSLGFAPMLLSHGYSLLLPESRGHGESGGFVTYGVRESTDIVQWLSWMKDNGVNSAFGLGESLGAAILIQSLAKGAHFQSIVAECSYSSFESVADERIGRIVPTPLARLFVDEGIEYVRLRYRVNLFDARPDSAIANAHIPILLIHGTADDRTSPENSIRLAHLNPKSTTLWLVPGAKHTGAYADDPKAFEQHVLRAFDAN